MYFISFGRIGDEIDHSQHQSVDSAAYRVGKLHNELSSGMFHGAIMVAGYGDDAVTFATPDALPDDFIEQIQGIN